MNLNYITEIGTGPLPNTHTHTHDDKHTHTVEFNLCLAMYLNASKAGFKFGSREINSLLRPLN